MVDALIDELEMRKAYLGSQSISTIYFGGGSPSILGAELLGKILFKVRKWFRVEDLPEITLEANPDDMTSEALRDWKNLGVNRLSVGIQSFMDDRLKTMNRAHNADESMHCIALAQNGGFDNFSIDLIYGLPKMTPEEWQGQIDQALSLGVQHISAYCLTIEPKTVFGKLHERGEMKAVDDDAASSQFFSLRNSLLAAGFDHYEVSNFGLPNFHSKHNSAYWSGAHYLGIGPSAHSFDGKSRQWNVSNNSKYMKSVEGGSLEAEQEYLSAANLFNERVMTGLRTSAGIDTKHLRLITEFDINTLFKDQIQEYCLEGSMRVHKDHIILTPQGLLQADGIASELFIIEP